MERPKTRKELVTDQLNLGQVEDSAKRNYLSLFPEEQIHSVLDAFVINKPMSGKVGGDGFFVHQDRESLYIAVFDCMGHGHLASMMTRIYTNGLKKVLAEMEIKDPAEILIHLHNEIKTKFEEKTNLQVGTGADVGIVRISMLARELTFAGAKMDLLQVTNGEMETVKADRMQVGEMWDVDRSYNNVPISLDGAQGSKFYLSSDGLRDLFGGPEGKKLGKKNVQGMLELNFEYPMARQKDIFTKYIEDWTGSEMQLDDLLVIGFNL